jgi:hypothetical protein
MDQGKAVISVTSIAAVAVVSVINTILRNDIEYYLQLKHATLLYSAEDAFTEHEPVLAESLRTYDSGVVDAINYIIPDALKSDLR